MFILSQSHSSSYFTSCYFWYKNPTHSIILHLSVTSSLSLQLCRESTYYAILYYIVNSIKTLKANFGKLIQLILSEAKGESLQ